MKRLQWLFAFLTAVGGAVVLYAQNPVSIAQIGTTTVTTTIPVSGTVTASGPLTDAQLRASAVPVSGTVTANMGTVTADPFGANADAASATGSISAKLRFIASTGIPVTALPSNASVNQTQWAGTAVDVNSGNKSAGTLRVVLATDQPALTNKLLVTPDSVALPANQSVNVSQINGVTTTMNNGVSGTGVQRVTLASDSTGQVTIAAGANTIGALTANQSVNVAQINGVTPLMGNGTTGTGSHRVTIASDNSAVSGMGVGATGAAPPANANYIAGITSGATGGFLSAGVTVCDSSGYLDMTTATTTEIAPLVASRTIRVCSIVAMANGITVMTLKRGTGTNCGTGTTSVSPAFDLTAQTGFSAGAGFGEIIGPAGAGTAGGAMTSGNALCVTSSAAVNLHVIIRYAVY